MHLRQLLPALVLASSAASLSAQQTVQVTQVNFDFSPANISVDCGDTVEWVWTFGTHTVTEGTDDSIDPTDAFHYVLDGANVSHTFSTKFLFQNPRPNDVYPYVCVPHFAFGMTGTVAVDCPWTNLGNAKAGVAGEPLLYGNGTLAAGSAAQLVLEEAAPSSQVALFVGLVEGAAPFKGGVLVPVPILLQLDLSTAAWGGFTVPFAVPSGLSGVPVYFQSAIADGAASQGVALSNAMRADF